MMKRFIVAMGIAAASLTLAGTDHVEAKPRHSHRASNSVSHHRAGHHIRQRHHVHHDARHRARNVRRHTRAVPVVQEDSTWSFFSENNFTQTTTSYVNSGVRAVRAGVKYLPHPPGCPRVLFCGCGAANDIFGKPRRDLWLAENWIHKFRHVPRSMARPNMAAARRGHVFVLKEHRRGNIWLVADYNSGNHMSRLHERSIAGYIIVDPRG